MRDLAFLHEETEDVETRPEHPDEILRRLQGWALRSRMQELTDEIRRAEDMGGDVAPLLEKKQGLAAALRELEAPGRQPEGNFR